MTATAASPVRGSEWVAKGKKHKGMNVRIRHITKAGGVSFQPVGSDGASWNGSKSGAGPWTLPLEIFLARYEPYAAPVEKGTQTAFRRQYTPVVEDDPEPAVPVETARHDIVPSFHVMLVTPAQAQSWLDKGSVNRKLSEFRVDMLVTAIRRGAWHITNDAIVIDDTGGARNGQHRLHAIVKSGIPVQLPVAYGVSDAAFDVMDTGRARTASDVLSIHGYPSTAATAAAVRGLMLIEAYGRLMPVDRGVVTTDTTLAYLRDHPEVTEGVRLADRVHSAKLAGGTGLWAIPMTMFYRIDPDAASEFVDMLSTGVNLAADSPILLLRNRAIAMDRNGGHHAREFLIAIAIKAWNAWRAGKRMKQLFYRGADAEKFPVPI